MKRWIAVLVLLPAIGWAQTVPVTPNYQLPLIPNGYQNWGPLYRTSMVNIDSMVQGKLTLTTTGSSGAATLTGNVLNIPQYTGGGANGFPITLGSTPITASSTTTSVTGLTLNGVSPATFTFLDPISSVQTQLNGKQTTLSLTTTGSSGAATLTGNVLNIPNYAASGLSGMTSGQVAIAGSATTVTSSKALAGNGAGITTGPVSGVANGDLVAFSGTSGQIADSGLSAGAVVTTVGTQTLTNKTIDGVTPATFAFIDPTSSIQTQLNGKLSTTGSSAGLSQATASAFGVVKPDGTTITVSGGVLTAVAGGISGLTAGYIPIATSGTAVGNSFIDYNLTNTGSYTSTKPIVVNDSTDSNFIGFQANGVVPAVTANSAGWGLAATLTSAGTYLMPDAPATGFWYGTNASGVVTNTFVARAGAGAGVTTGPVSGTANNDVVVFNGTTGQIADSGISTNSFAQKIGTGATVLGTAAIAAGACGTVTTVSAGGTATTDTILWTFNTNPAAVTGYGASGKVSVDAYPTVNNVNFIQCNNTAASITPDSITVNYRVIR